MRILVGWDDEVEAQTIELILNVDETSAGICNDADEFRKAATEEDWDVVLMATQFPNEEEALKLFEVVQDSQPNIPVVGAWKQGEFTNLARFISNGLHSNHSTSSLPQRPKGAQRGTKVQNANDPRPPWAEKGARWHGSTFLWSCCAMFLFSVTYIS